MEWNCRLKWRFGVCEEMERKGRRGHGYFSRSMDCILEVGSY